MKLCQFGRAPGILCLLLAAFPLTACGDDANSPHDAATPDASLPDATPPADADPNKLSSQGLYSDIKTHTIGPAAIEYTPNYALWADEAAKRRWIVLPPDTKIETSDMDHWQFPVGTRLWKEFATPEGKLLETRLIEKKPDGTFFFGAFVWQEDGLEAILTLDGASNILGTMHDVPSKARCVLCHKGESGRILGFSAMQLSKDGAAPTLKSLAADHLLTDPPPADTDYRFPGDAKAQAAMGYLHANCGHCHTPDGTAYNDTCIAGTTNECMQLQFRVADAAPHAAADSAVMKSLVGIPTHSNTFPSTTRLTAHNTQMSAIYVRPSQRGGAIQMPPAFSTEVVDTTGIAALEAWIDSL